MTVPGHPGAESEPLPVHSVRAADSVFLWSRLPKCEPRLLTAALTATGIDGRLRGLTPGPIRALTAAYVSYSIRRMRPGPVRRRPGHTAAMWQLRASYPASIRAANVLTPFQVPPTTWIARVSTHLDRAYSRDNLRRAWTYIKSSPDAHYKSYFRPQYDAFAAAEENYLETLRKQLADGSYRPTHATKVYIPKRSGILRTVSLLSVEDQIVYQAFANVVADRFPKRVTRRSYKSVFAHVYAGPRSLWFYKKWTVGYRRFNAAIVEAVEDGYVYAASFDLTACYDSIGHKVLRHFLDQFGLNPEFSDAFLEILSHWTAGNQAEQAQRIYLGHGIPQGPLSSGLFSEVVLHHFEDAARLPKGVRYFRYVDGIRLYAHSPEELRRALITLDYVSKWVGLFPQGAKIGIRRVRSADDEIKSVSMLPGADEERDDANQDQIHKELVRVSRRYTVSDETQFKWLLGAARPRAVQSKRLLQILRRSPHLYLPISRYFRRYQKLPRTISRDLHRLLSSDMTYFASEAELLHATFNRVHPTYRVHFINYCERRWEQLRRVRHAEDLKEALLRWLLAENRLSYPRITAFFSSSNFDPWLRSATIHSLPIEHMGAPSYERILNDLICMDSNGPAISAAYLLLKNDLRRTAAVKRLNYYASSGLVEFGLVRSRQRRPSIIHEYFGAILKAPVPSFDWKTSMGKQHPRLERQLITVRGYGQTDPTAFVLSLDVALDMIVHALTQHDGTVGRCTLGHMGAFVFQGRSRFAKKYPRLRRACVTVHDLRYRADLAHPLTRSSRKPTSRIKHASLRDVRRKVASGLDEMIRAW